MLNLLFVCTSNLDRSVKAEEIINESGKNEAKSCGILPHVDRQVTKTAVEWADTIFCMEHEHKEFIIKKYSDAINKIKVLNITNDLTYGDKELEEKLRKKLKEWI